jgi:transcriptional regulator with XRE-family HTH domain
MSVISRKFADELAEKAMRDAYLEAQTRTKLAQQIRALRVQRGWQQRELGHLMDKPQGNVARLEDREVARYTLTTLFELASAFDVGFIAKFVTYEDFLRDTEDLTEAALKVRSFNRAALNELCADPDASVEFGIWARMLHSDLRPSRNILLDQNVLTGFSEAWLTRDRGAPMTTGLNRLAHNGTDIWSSLFNSTAHQVRLPSPRDEEIARLQHALAESEREKAILQNECAILRDKINTMREPSAQLVNTLRPPALIWQNNSSSLI